VIREDDEVARKPAQSLPDDPARKRGVHYNGLYVVWWDDGSWEWQKCVNCGAQLTSRASRERGYGPSCATVVTSAATEAILREERINAEAYLEEKRHPAPRPHRSAKGRPIDTSGLTRIQLPAVPRSSGQRPAQRAKGITNEQAKELGRLQRAAGEPYTGNGMTAREARQDIQRLKR
jgi:hypothetical protein